MIKRLQQVLTRLEQLPPEVQEEAAAQLELLTEAFEAIQTRRRTALQRSAQALQGYGVI
jgi:hypothetical protein